MDSLVAARDDCMMSEDAARGQVAGSAAEVYESFFVPALFAQWPPVLLAAAGVGSGQRVLDVGCGTGIVAAAAASRASASKVGSPRWTPTPPCSRWPGAGQSRCPGTRGSPRR